MKYHKTLQYYQVACLAIYCETEDNGLSVVLLGGISFFLKAMAHTMEINHGTGISILLFVRLEPANSLSNSCVYIHILCIKRFKVHRLKLECHANPMRYTQWIGRYKIMRHRLLIFQYDITFSMYTVMASNLTVTRQMMYLVIREFTNPFLY